MFEIVHWFIRQLIFYTLFIESFTTSGDYDYFSYERKLKIVTLWNNYEYFMTCCHNTILYYNSKIMELWFNFRCLVGITSSVWRYWSYYLHYISWIVHHELIFLIYKHVLIFFCSWFISCDLWHAAYIELGDTTVTSQETSGSVGQGSWILYSQLFRGVFCL